MRPLGKSTTTVLPPYAKYPSSSPRLTVVPFCPPAVHLMLPTCAHTSVYCTTLRICDKLELTSIAPIATKATGVLVGVCVTYSTDRLFAVNTSNPGSFTACGLTEVESRNFVRRTTSEVGGATDQCSTLPIYRSYRRRCRQEGCGTGDNPGEPVYASRRFRTHVGDVLGESVPEYRNARILEELCLL